jgi:hypothetical protein
LEHSPEQAPHGFPPMHLRPRGHQRFDVEGGVRPVHTVSMNREIGW